MRNSAVADVTKIVGYVVICLVLAALISPSLYQIGKGFAEATGSRDTAENVSWLAAKARKAGFETYFKRALMLVAVVLLIPLVYSLKLRVDPRKLKQSRWSIYLPEVVRDQNIGQPLVKNPAGLHHLLMGIGLSGGVFLMMSALLFQLGWFYFGTELTGSSIGHAAKRAITPAIVTSIIEETIFRGALLGIFLRAFRPWMAIGLLSLLFAAVHFLQPPPGVSVTNPGSFLSGFEMLRLIGTRFLEPQAMLYEFASLLLVALILGHARYGTASLWLPIGLHIGWIFSYKVFKKLAVRDPELPERYDIFIGETLVEGIIPLCALFLTWAFLFPFIRNPKDADPN